MSESIKSLKKVQLSLEAFLETERGKQAKTGSFSFIYDTSSDGLCLLEVALSDKCQDDVVEIEITQANMHETCGHLLQPLCVSLALKIIPAQMTLKMTVLKVEDAENREIVQAIAKSLRSGGCGGKCDCGCS